MVRQALLLLAGLLLSLMAHAGIYMHRDANGNPVFTDRPSGSASTEVPLSPLNEWTAPPVPERPAPEKTEPAKPAASYTSVEILAPAMDATVRDNAGNVTVQVASEPALRPGHLFRLLLDGQPATADQAGNRFQLTNVDRGTHQLLVAILDERGRQVAQSAPVAIHVKRLSLAQRRQAQPCKLEDYGVRLECPLKDKPKKPDIPFVPFI